MVNRGRCLLILLFVGAWLRSLQHTENRSHTEELRSDDDEVVQPQRLPSCLLETNTICSLEPLSIAEAMERLLIPAVRVWGESSPTLAEIVCRVLANDSRGIIVLRDMMGEKRRGVLMGSILLYTTMKIPTVT